ETVLAESVGEELAGLPVLLEHSSAQLACSQQAILCVQESVAQLLYRQSLAGTPWGPAGVQIVGLRLVQFEGLLPSVGLDADQGTVDGASPETEVMNLAPDFLLPPSGDMRSERECRVGF